MKRIEHMFFWERACLPEVVRGLSITAYHFWRNLSIHILHAFGLAKTRQADVTVRYPEERALYPDSFRGRHRTAELEAPKYPSKSATTSNGLPIALFPVIPVVIFVLIWSYLGRKMSSANGDLT